MRALLPVMVLVAMLSVETARAAPLASCPATAYEPHELAVGTVPIAPFVDGTFDNHGYAFALAACSPLRESVNLALLQFVATEDWPAILARYLGTP